MALRRFPRKILNLGTSRKWRWRENSGMVVADPSQSHSSAAKYTLNLWRIGKVKRCEIIRVKIAPCNMSAMLGEWVEGALKSSAAKSRPECSCSTRSISLEAVAGSFRVPQSARKDRLRDRRLNSRRFTVRLRCLVRKMGCAGKSVVNFKENWIWRERRVLLITPKRCETVGANRNHFVEDMKTQSN